MCDDDLTGERDRAAMAMQGVSGSWDWDILADRLHVDPRFAELYGLDPAVTRDGVEPRLFFSRIHPDDRPRIKIAVAGMLAGAEVFAKEFRILGDNGAVRWMHARGQSHFDADDRPVRFAGLLVDVTERRRTEERLRIAQTAGGVGTFEHHDGFATATVSPQFCRVLGLHPAEVLPVSTINGVVCEGSGPLIPEGEASEIVAAAEFRICRANDDAVRWIARRGEVVESSDGSGHSFIGVIYDVTAAKEAELQLREFNETLESRVEQAVGERVRAEEALRQAQKMEAVGQLTGGIAHDFNNLLTVIIGNVDTALRRLPEDADPRVQRALSHAAKGAERAAALTQRLLAFSRRQPLDARVTDVAALLTGMTDLLSRSITEAIAVEVHAADDLWMIEVDPHQLENAILNLAVNARDAMEEGGSLRIDALNLPASREIAIEVRDTGCGMSAETLGKVFDPFFTTKEVGKGTGLGLSMVHGFVNQSGGRVEIRSTPGAGTVVRLFFPALVEGAALPHPLPERQAVPGSRGETILVVEDDEDVRSYTAGLLSELGYRTIAAADGAAALQLLQRKDEPVDLVLTDVVMPAMSGRQLAEAARGLRPGIPVLFTSGYPREEIGRDGRLEPGVELLAKPFGHDALAEKVRDMLDGAAA